MLPEEPAVVEEIMHFYYQIIHIMEAIYIQILAEAEVEETVAMQIN